MMKKQQGFTLIELIVVIVILGILAATAMPKFVDLSTDAKRAKAQGVAGAVASSASIQKAANLVNGAAYASATACTDGAYLEPAGLPTGCTGVMGATTCVITCDGQASSAVAIAP